MSVLVVFAALESALAEPTEGSTSDSQVVHCRRYESAGWLIQQTNNFRICTRNRTLDLVDLPAICETLRSTITTTWLEQTGPTRWTPRCDVIVHASLGEYQRALGSGVGRSVGCATMQVEQGRIVSRRIDIRVDADSWQQDALPHELTHVVLADHFNGKRLPPWADEGIGVLSESKRKQQIRARAFKESARHGRVYSPASLMALRRFPQSGYREAFYAQSGALVRELLTHGTPQQFIQLVELTQLKGESKALAIVYDRLTSGDLSEITKPQRVETLLSGPITVVPTLIAKAN